MTKKELAICVVVGIAVGITILLHSRQKTAPIGYPPLPPGNPIVVVPPSPSKPIVNPPPRRIPPVLFVPPGDFEPLTCCVPGLIDPISCSISENTATFVSGGETIKRRTSVITYSIFDHQISNDNRRATKRLLLPQFPKIDSAKLEITAYNDDPAYPRSIWFEIDNRGGNIGTYHAGIHDVGGEGVIGPKQTKTLNFDLQSVQFGYTGKTGTTQQVNLFEELIKPVMHTIRSSVTTYDQYGPKSWVSIKLILTITQEKRDKLVSAE
jgi:hypothetical protein